VTAYRDQSEVIFPVVQTAHGFSPGQALRRDTTVWVKALADTSANGAMVGVVDRVINANTFYLRLTGKITGLSGLTSGTTYYLSTTTPGALSPTAPSTVGQLYRPVLVADSATSGYVYNDAGMVVGTGPPGPPGPIGDITTSPIWDAKGDLAVGTGPDTSVRLPVGTQGFHLLSDSAQATGLRWRRPLAVYNVVTEFGADNTGATDAMTAIQNAINACIAGGGGEIYMPPGTYSISGTLDFSAADNLYKEITFRGAGHGLGYNSPSGATKIVYSGTGTALKVAPPNGIWGFRMESFTLKCTQSLGSNYAVDWNNVAGNGGMKDVIIAGNVANPSGNGLMINNAYNGQMTFENVVVTDFRGGTAFTIDCATRLGAIQGAASSAHLLFNNCTGQFNYSGWVIRGTGDNMSAVVLNDCGSGGLGTGAGPALSIGASGTYTSSHTINSFNCEDHGLTNTYPAILIGPFARGCVFNALYVRNPYAPTGVGAVHLDGCYTCAFWGTRVHDFTYGVVLKNNAAWNIVQAYTSSGEGGGTVSQLFLINESTCNTLFDKYGRTVHQTYAGQGAFCIAAPVPTGGVFGGPYTRLGQQLELNQSANYGGLALNNWAAANQQSVLDFNKSRSVTPGTMTVVQSQDNLGQIIFRGADGSGFQDAAYILGSVDGTPGANDMPGRLTFATTPDGTNAAVERLRIDNKGNIVINPSASVLVSGATDGFLYIPAIGPTSGQLPSGVPTAQGARVAIAIDATNGRFVAYYNGAWHYAAMT
jgi:pectate lyase-like protein